jgi:serine phosphatase RsbU (regulator of sigma subunit)
MTLATGATDQLAWAAAGAPYPGEINSGDGHLVLPRSLRTLIAVMDGLGHGSAAHAATMVATTAIADIPDAPLPSLFEHCNEALRRTRGVVMTLASITDDGQMQWMGVGNVEGLIVRSTPPYPHEGLLSRGGVVGWRLPSLHLSSTRLDAGDLLVMATDGIRSDFVSTVNPVLSPQIIAAQILEEKRRDYDDALVLVARYDGDQG